ncbi:hypothetical protein [Desulfosporosinus hippei]|uniref:Uncharacterized protein n=1 Tax=Desulfosporosinus hippei DSM 8344 TaxID=1121419 RepID=A0A1G8CHN4_9FIRM|nr:hypothetical protein [Desulfosporosinus hippei]SDH44912.1 hypothetical protein SAMN05443529_113103 [Desulfosporosinus hippei DSM 8344]
MEPEFKKEIDDLHDFMTEQGNFSEDVIERLNRIEAKIEVLLLETSHIRREKKL